MLFVYWFLWPLRLVWLLVCCLYKEVYLQIFKCVSFWLHGCCGEWEGGTVNEVNHTSWMAVVTPTDRPKSVRNRCLIKLFCGVVCVVTFPFWHFCWCRGFCHRTGSDLLLFVFAVVLMLRPYYGNGGQLNGQLSGQSTTFKYRNSGQLSWQPTELPLLNLKCRPSLIHMQNISIRKNRGTAHFAALGQRSWRNVGCPWEFCHAN